MSWTANLQLLIESRGFEIVNAYSARCKDRVLLPYGLVPIEREVAQPLAAGSFLEFEVIW
jgi:hypothetical protein